MEIVRKRTLTPGNTGRLCEHNWVCLKTSKSFCFLSKFNCFFFRVNLVKNKCEGQILRASKRLKMKEEEKIEETDCFVVGARCSNNFISIREYAKYFLAKLSSYLEDF